MNSRSPRVVAMGFPAVGSEALYRNPLAEVKPYLDARYDRRYKVYNLCRERQHQYDDATFDGRVARYPFFDHTACPLAMLPAFVADATAYMATDPQAAVCVHCKAGKGRTGLFVCVLLLAMDTRAGAPPSSPAAAAAAPSSTEPLTESGSAAAAADPETQALTATAPAPAAAGSGGAASGGAEDDVEMAPVFGGDADAVMDFYGERRTHDGKGLTLRGQRRYVRYYAHLLKAFGGAMPPGAPPSLAVTGLRLHHLGKLSARVVAVFHDDRWTVYHADGAGDAKCDFTDDGDGVVTARFAATWAGDVRIEFRESAKDGAAHVGSLSVHTHFVANEPPPLGGARYPLCELDKLHKRTKDFDGAKAALEILTA